MSYRHYCILCLLVKILKMNKLYRYHILLTTAVVNFETELF